MTEKLFALRHGDLRQAEFEGFIKQFLTDFDASKISLTDSLLLDLISEMRTKLSQLGKGFEQLTIHETAEKIAQADEERDHHLTALLSSIKLFAKSYDSTEKEAYTLLKNVFANYKSLARENYEVETTEVEHLLAKLKDASLKEALETLGIIRFVDRLTKSQEQFVALYNGRSTATATKVVYDNKKTRQELQSLYKDFSDLVTIYRRRQVEKAPDELLQVINASRKRYADILAKRKGLKPDTSQPIPEQTP